MQVSKRILVLAVALCAVMALGSSALAGGPVNLVRNGSFEFPEVTGDFDTYIAGQEIDGWDVVSGSVDVVEEPRFDAFRGKASPQALDLNGSGPGSVAQDLDTDAGQEYLLRFFLAGNPECGTDDVKVLDVWWGGELVATFYYDTSDQEADDLNYQLRALELTAEEGTTELRFSSDNPGACGPMIDVVRVREA
jgi:choice-of-anchor C domain-containing protein